MRTVFLPLKHLSRRLDAVLASVADQTQAKVKRVLHFPNQVEVARRTGHGPPILKPFGAGLLAPQQGSHLSPPLLTHTLQPHRGDTMYPSNSIITSGLPPQFLIWYCF